MNLTRLSFGGLCFEPVVTAVTDIDPIQNLPEIRPRPIVLRSLARLRMFRPSARNDDPLEEAESGGPTIGTCP